MSTHDEKDLLARTLRQQSETMAGHGLGLDDVRDRARGIRRRRRAVTGVVAAAVLAVAVPVGLSATDLLDTTSPAPLPPASSGEGDPAPGPGGPIELAGVDAPRGTDPSVGYTAGRVLHLPDGSTTTLQRSLSGLAPWQGDGWVGFDWADGTTYFLDADGQVVDSQAGTGTAVGSDGVDLAYTLRATGGRDLVLDSTDGSRSPVLSTTVAATGEVTPIGFVGPGRLAFMVEDDRGNAEVAVTDFEGRPTGVEGLLTARAANAETGVVAGYTSIDERAPGSCSALVDASTGRQLWETCDFTLSALSPDGRYVLGEDAYLDGIGGRTAAILDASDGTVLAEFTTADQAFTGGLVWESDSTALVSVHESGTWWLLRLRPDGTVEQALDPVRAGEMSNPWGFVAQP